jgi:hypothetical protein
MYKRAVSIVLCLALALVAVTGCQSKVKPEAVVQAFAQPWKTGDLDASKLDTIMANFADQAVFKMVGMPPGQPDTFEGKAAIRAAYESWIPLHPKLQIDVLKVEGDTVTAKTLYWSDMMSALDVAPLEGTDVYIVKDGKIQSEVWTLTDESRNKLMVAVAAAAPAPTLASQLGPTATVVLPTSTPLPPTSAPLPPTPTLGPEKPITSINDVTGSWLMRVQGEWYIITFKEAGRYLVGFEGNLGAVGQGDYTIEGNNLLFLTSAGPDAGAGACSSPAMAKATYQVFVVKVGDTPVQLRFVLVGEDLCPDRNEAMVGKTLKPYKP